MKDKQGKPPPPFYENENHISYDESQQSQDDTTPRIRPWNVNIKSNYDPKEPQDDHDEFLFERQRPELILPSSEDEDEEREQGDEDEEDEEQYKNSMSSNDSNSDEKLHSQQPMTPSRLLTISSIDFYDQPSSNRDPQPMPMPLPMPMNRTNQSSYSYPQSSTTLPQQQQQQQQLPTYPSDITGEVDIDAEVKYHDDLILDSMNQLNLTAQIHFQTILEKLITKYSNIIQMKDDFIHQQLIGHKQSITDLQTLLTNYEHKVEVQFYQTEQMKLNLMNFYLKRYSQHISSYSLKKILHEWKLVVLRNRIYPHLTRQAIKFHRKKLLSSSFQFIYRYALHSKYQRKLSLQTLKSNQQMTEIIQRYETDMTTLQLEVKNSFQLLQHEKYSKLHLEENLRRLFLKNMTVMNMDALSLFQDSGEVSEPLWMTARDELITTTPLPMSSSGSNTTTIETSVLSEKKKIELMRRQREQLEHEQYLQEQQSLRNEMRIQQEELVKQKQLQQQQPMGTPKAATAITKRGATAGPPEKNGDPTDQKARQTKTKKGTSAIGAKKISSVAGTTGSGNTTGANVFTITGPTYHSKRIISNESSSQQYSQTSSTMTQQTSTMVSSSSSSSMVSSSRIATSRFDEKLFNTLTSKQGHLSHQPSPPPVPLPMPHPSLHLSPSAAPVTSSPHSDSDDDNDPPPQPRRGGPQAIR